VEKRLDLDTLTRAGFYHAGAWRKHVSLLEEGAPRTPGVYALVQDDIVMFVGKSDRRLDARLRVQRHRAEGGRGREVHSWLRDTITANGRVDVYVLECAEEHTEWRGLPVDVLAGLEAALIRELDPVYNRDGRADRVAELAA
jgi:hypothetical protein